MKICLTKPTYEKKIGENGIDSEFFTFLVDSTDTDITVPDCYYWEKYITKLCKR